MHCLKIDVNYPKSLMIYRFNLSIWNWRVSIDGTVSWLWFDKACQSRWWHSSLRGGEERGDSAERRIGHVVPSWRSQSVVCMPSGKSVVICAIVFLWVEFVSLCILLRKFWFFGTMLNKTDQVSNRGNNIVFPWRHPIFNILNYLYLISYLSVRTSTYICLCKYLPDGFNLFLLLLEAALGLVAELAELGSQPLRALLLCFAALYNNRL